MTTPAVEPVTCPVCDTTAVPLVAIGALVICGACGASLFVDDGGQVRRAKHMDLADLSEVDLKQVRHARALIARVKA